jgi:hypothetical protein
MPTKKGTQNKIVRKNLPSKKLFTTVMCGIMLVLEKAVRAYNGHDSLFKDREGFFRGRENASGVYEIPSLDPGAL